MLVIELKGKLTFLELIKKLNKESLFKNNWDLLTINISKSASFDLLSLNFLYLWISKCKDENKDVIINSNTNLLLSHIGLLHLLEGENECNNPNFVNMYSITDPDSVIEPVDLVCKFILDKILVEVDDATNFFKSFEWSINEVTDNIINHSSIDIPNGVICAKYNKKNKTIEVAISDFGKGLSSTLNEAEQSINIDSTISTIPTEYNLLTHKKSIEKALQRGVTRSKEKGQGNGLAGMKEIIQLNKGKLEIYTGNAFFYKDFNNDIDSYRSLPIELQGTGIYLEFNLEFPVSLSDTFIGRESVSIFIENYLDSINQKGGLKIKEECIHVRGRTPARKIRTKILNLLSELEEPLIIDFKDITTPATSFLDELLGLLTLDLGEVIFRQKIKIINMDEFVIKMSNVVIYQRLKGI